MTPPPHTHTHTRTHAHAHTHAHTHTHTHTHDTHAHAHATHTNERTGLCADVPEVSAIEAVPEFGHRLKVNVAFGCDGLCVDLQNLKPRLLVWQWNLCGCGDEGEERRGAL